MTIEAKATKESVDCDLTAFKPSPGQEIKPSFSDLAPAVFGEAVCSFPGKVSVSVCSCTYSTTAIAALGSIRIPGPIVLVTVIVRKNDPFDAAGFDRRTESINAE